MAWTAPMTAVAGNAFTATQFNTHVRDNLLETAPAKATAAGNIFVSTGSNAIAQRTPVTAFNAASGTTSSTSFTTSLGGTPGTNPSVTVTTGTKALVTIGAQVNAAYSAGGSAGTLWSIMGYAVSGTSTISATEDHAFTLRQGAGLTSQQIQGSTTRLIDGLTPGSNTFTLQYMTSYSADPCTATFQRRSISVIPF